MKKVSPTYQKHIFVCIKEREKVACCAKKGSVELREKLKAAVKAKGLQNEVRVYKSSCQNHCEEGPNILIFPDNVWYKGVHEKDLETILKIHVAGKETR